MSQNDDQAIENYHPLIELSAVFQRWSSGFLIENATTPVFVDPSELSDVISAVPGHLKKSDARSTIFLKNGRSHTVTETAEQINSMRNAALRIS